MNAVYNYTTTSLSTMGKSQTLWLFSRLWYINLQWFSQRHEAVSGNHSRADFQNYSMTDSQCEIALCNKEFIQSILRLRNILPEVVITLYKLSRGNSETLSSSFERQTDWKLVRNSLLEWSGTSFKAFRSHSTQLHSGFSLYALQTTV